MAFDFQHSLVPGENMFHNRQPQAGATGIRRPAAIDTVEAFRQPGKVVILYAYAIVLHGDL